MSYRIARFISNVLIPPTWSLLLIWSFSIYFGQSFEQILVWGLVGSFFTVILPIFYVIWLYKRGRVTQFHIPVRSQRYAPYILSLALIVLAYFFLHLLKAPTLLLAAFLASVGNTIFILVVNFFWKISAHMMGAAGPLVALSFAFGIWTGPLYLLLFAIGWSRIKLKAHTPAQVWAGGLAGLILTYIQLVLYLNRL